MTRIFTDYVIVNAVKQSRKEIDCFVPRNDAQNKKIRVIRVLLIFNS